MTNQEQMEAAKTAYKTELRIAIRRYGTLNRLYAAHNNSDFLRGVETENQWISELNQCERELLAMLDIETAF